VLTESAIQAVIADILDREDGYTDNPADRGGATNFGITQDTANDYGLGDVRNLTRDQAAAAYVRMFHDWGIDAIPDVHVFGLTADSCVQHGPGNGIKWLQMALGTSADGVCGPRTKLLAQADQTTSRTYYSILATRMRFYGHIIAKNHSQAEFAEGWMNRLSEFVYPVPQWP
jgi:lysozyme family protein